MNFKDKWATDEDGNQFLFTIELQRQLDAAGLPIEPAALKELKQGRPPQKSQESREQTRPKREREKETHDTKAPPIEFEEPADIQIDLETGKYIGRIKWFNGGKGYGFIARGGGEQIFFHKSNVQSDRDQYDEGAWVLYDVEETPKGFEAVDVEFK